MFENFILFSLITSGIQIYKNCQAKKIIEKEGYLILEDHRDDTTKYLSFIKDYFYILIPFYNLYRGLKLVLISNKEYAKIRREKLFKLKLIENSNNNVEIKKIDYKDKAKGFITKTNDKIKSYIYNKNNTNNETILDIINNTTDIEYLNRLKIIYIRKSQFLREKYYVVRKEYDSNKSKEIFYKLNSIVNRVIIYDNIYKEILNRINYLDSNFKEKKLRNL